MVIVYYLKFNHTKGKKRLLAIFHPSKIKRRFQAPLGFEPKTSCLQDRRSNQLSYGAMCERRLYLKKLLAVSNGQM